MSRKRFCLSRKDSIYNAAFAIVCHKSDEKSEIFSLLHPCEVERYNALKHANIQKGYLLGRIAAKKAIAELHPDIAIHNLFIDRGVFGFPVVKGDFNQKLQVSISHCETIAIALAFPEAHPLGIDLEKVDAGKLGALKNAMAIQEINGASDQELNFEQYATLLWTIKEALSKILRTGLTLDFKLLEVVELKLAGGVYLSAFKNFPQYKAISFFAGDFVCSLVLPRDTEVELGDLVEAFVAQLG